MSVSNIFAWLNFSGIVSILFCLLLLLFSITHIYFNGNDTVKMGFANVINAIKS